jgi:sortase A
MTLYTYVKAPPGHRLKTPRSSVFYLRLVISVLLLTFGIASFTTVAYPILSYQFFYAPMLQKNSALISPLGSNLSDNLAQAKVAPEVRPEVLGTVFDYTDSSFWYPTQTVQKRSTPKLSFTVTIPKLKIYDALARNDNTDLKESLIHYPTTASPGDLGNSVIFGHSVLPQYFNPQSYETIFSTLHTLKRGDEIIIYDHNATFRYIIAEMYETSPDDLSPLAQSYDNRYLTLITCTPPGTYLRRLIIKAVLV